jgi:hypothetical protein
MYVNSVTKFLLIFYVEYVFVFKRITSDPRSRRKRELRGWGKVARDITFIIMTRLIVLGSESSHPSPPIFVKVIWSEDEMRGERVVLWLCSR